MDNVNVVIRTRPPPNDCEKSKSPAIQWETNADSIHQIDEFKKPVCNPYVFNRVFGTEDNNECIFQDVARPILDAVMQGYNGSIFAYGQTASGKTYTMMGSNRSPGLVPRMVESIFTAIENTLDRGYLLRVSYIEIYNERIYDLLSNTRKSLNIREDANGQPFVENLKMEVVKCMPEIMKLMRIGEKNRTFGATAMNPNSSRSHAIFRIIIESGVLSSNEGDSPGISNRDLSSGEADIMVSHLNLIDLAGSERTGQMNAIGGKFREGCSINTSLLALRNVISKLSQGGEGMFINYRDSKLTRILQSSLGGNAKTSIICTVNPTVVDETHSTLKFASMAKCIINKPTRNVVVTEATLLKQYANEVAELQNKLLSQKKESLDQEKMKLQLEETSLRNKELEERISKMKESVITSSVLFNSDQRMRRETWGGFKAFGASNIGLLPQTPMKGIPEMDFCQSAQSIRTTASLFGLDFINLKNDSKNFGCQVALKSQAERKLSYEIRLLKAQASFESDKLIAMEKQHEELIEQVDFLKHEHKIIECENEDLNVEIENLKTTIAVLEQKLNENLAENSLKLTPTCSRQGVNCSELNASLGLIPGIEKDHGMLLPWSENELLDKLSTLEKEVTKYRQQAAVAEAEFLRLEESSSKYRKTMEKTLDDLTSESEVVRATALKLKTELENNVEQRQAEKREWRLRVANSESKAMEMETMVENLTLVLSEKEDEINDLTDKISNLEHKIQEQAEQNGCNAEFKAAEFEANCEVSTYWENEKNRLNNELLILSENTNEKSVEINTLKQCLKDTQNTLLEMEEKFNGCFQDVERWKTTVSEKDTEIDRLLVDARDLQKEINNCEAQNKQLNDDIFLLNETAKQKNTEIDDLKQLLKDSENNLLEMEDQLNCRYRDVETWKKSVSEKEVEIDHLMTTIKNLKEANGDTEQREYTSDNWESERNQLNDDIFLLNTVSAEKSKEIDDVKQLLKESQNNLLEMEHNFNSRHQESEQWKTSVREKELEIANLLTTIKNLEKENDNCELLKTKSSDHELRIDDLLEQCGKAKNENLLITEQKNLEIEEFKQKVSELENELNNPTHRIGSQKEKSENNVDKSLVTLLEQERDVNRRLTSELESLKVKLEEDRQFYGTQLKHFANKNVEFEENKLAHESNVAYLKTNLKQLKSERHRLRDQVRRLQTPLNNTLAISSEGAQPTERLKVPSSDKWDGTYMSGSATTDVHKVETLQTENERLKKMLLQGCKRCQHLRNVISGKRSKHQENIPCDGTPQMHSNATVDDEEEVKNDEEESWSPLRPMVTWGNNINKTGTSSSVGTPQTPMGSQWSRITETYRLRQAKEAEARSGEVVQSRSSPVNSYRYNRESFIAEKDCKVQ